jgi:carbon monoxide dehydrogenase subunit G
VASIHKEFLIDASPEEVWAAVRDYGAVHERLVPGLLLDSRLDGDARIVTFANGFVVREVLVDLDDSARRVVYSSVEGRATHHNASMQAFAEGDGGSRLVWITDVLPRPRRLRPRARRGERDGYEADAGSSVDPKKERCAPRRHPRRVRRRRTRRRDLADVNRADARDARLRRRLPGRADDGRGLADPRPGRTYARADAADP